ncbi:hypothetical protein Y1Q_0022824 [Alligator mississippiensis]|uniref:Uncharacterized protein n=1 Tax=Alligator mississippiensis TaxID=8496 RepID=A0A151N4J1_ALLMI|nr:hypothetical protein Y1Q_0022824 [Alligator mississippiensis]
MGTTEQLGASAATALMGQQITPIPQSFHGCCLTDPSTDTSSSVGTKSIRTILVIVQIKKLQAYSKPKN